MGSGLLKKLGLATAIAGSVALGPRESKAGAVDWANISDIVPQAIGESINYTSSNSSSLPNKLTAILFVNDKGFKYAIGGFDLENGVVTQGYFNDDWNKTVNGYGLAKGDTANTPRGSGDADNTILQGYWHVFYDFDGNGNFNGDYLGQESFSNATEWINPKDYEITGFTPYGDNNPGNFKFTDYGIVPEPGVSALLLTGLSALALRRRRKISK